MAAQQRGVNHCDRTTASATSWSLFDSCASSMDTASDPTGEGLVPGEESEVWRWLVEQGFSSAGDLHTEEKFADVALYARYMHPMARGCFKGELGVCKWLYDNGAATDISRENEGGYTPMHFACFGGQLLVCKWLFKVGAARDVTRETHCKYSSHGYTPMHMACDGGHCRSVSGCSRWARLNTSPS